MNEENVSGIAGASEKVNELVNSGNTDIDRSQSYELLKEATKHLGIRQEFMAKAVGMSYYSYNRKVREESFTNDEILAAAQVVAKLYELESGSIFRKENKEPEKKELLLLVDITKDICEKLDNSLVVSMIRWNLSSIYTKVKQL